MTQKITRRDALKAGVLGVLGLVGAKAPPKDTPVALAPTVSPAPKQKMMVTGVWYATGVVWDDGSFLQDLDRSE